MAISKASAAKPRIRINVSDRQSTGTLDASNTEEIVEFNLVASKITLQGSGNLAGNVLVSINGVNYVSVGTIPASNGLLSYSSNMVTSVKIQRTGGSGKVVIVALAGAS